MPVGLGFTTMPAATSALRQTLISQQENCDEELYKENTIKTWE